MKADKVLRFRFLFDIFGLDRAKNHNCCLLRSEDRTNRNVLVS